ncbi:prolyl oligopeptidase family serine peptidase [Pelagicoccus sp. SDUM812002]|uniref:alpha/beta hydrolase family protein n=1 Tax=Pelagicoccus sp. SDUM812002 TaxID=3041266 RepID=UPI00280CF002|nr:prolyl oligopeptidase family serine peptidase [Pelagicoccus sp. SDUM812002]MDQ8184695.1 prolyl oligopeptidase family serine peptidase [Pelagicoccus sp. SDUM812002]
MKTPIVFRIVTCLLYLSLTTALLGQIEMQVDHEGEFRPVVYFQGFTPVVENEKGRRKKAKHERTRFVLVNNFADGKVEVDFLGARDPRQIRNNRIEAGKNSFEMEVELTSDRNLTGCHYILLFSSNDSMATYFDSIGSLSAGKTKKIKIKMPAQVDAIGSLHIFEQGREVRTQDSVAKRSLDDEFKELVQSESAVPNTVLFKRPRHFRHVVSPSGKHIATFRDIKTNVRVVVFDAETMQILQSVDIGEFDEELNDIEWLNDELVLYIFEEDLHSLNIQSGEIRKLYNSVHYITHVSPDGIHAVAYDRSGTYYNRDDDFITIDCIEGKRVSTETGNAFDSNRLDSEGKLRMKREYDTAGFTFKYREVGSKRWRKLDDLNNDPNIRFNYSPRDAVDQPVYVNGFAGDPNSIIVSSNLGRGTYGLYKYDLQLAKISEVLLEDDRFDIGGDGPEFRLLRNSRHNVIGVGYWKDDYTVKWFDEAFDTTQRAIEDALPKLRHMPIAWDDNANSIIFRSFSEKNPSTYYLFNRATKSIRNIYDVNPEVLEYELAVTKPIWIEAADGNNVQCYLTLPPNWDGEPLPLITHIHGGPTTRDLNRYDPINQFFATRNFAVLQVNYRGSTGFGRDYKLDGIIGNLDTTPIDDIAYAVRHLVDTNVALAEKIAIIGGSWGGYSVYLSMQRYPDLYACGVASAAPSDLKNLLKNDKAVRNRFAFHFWDEILRKQVEDPEYIFRASPISRVDDLQKPVLILQGEQDWRVNKNQADRMADAMKKAGKEHTLILYPEDGHGHNAFGWNHSLNETEAFIRTNLGL